MKPNRLIVPFSAALAALTVAAAAHGQSLTQSTRTDGTYRFSYPARPGVCGDGGGTIYINDGGRRSSIQMREGGINMSSSRYIEEWASLCETGPVRIALTVDGGEVLSLRTYVGGNWPSAGTARDLGVVTGQAAADYLIGVAEKGGKRVSHDAIFASTLAAGARVWPRLLTLAKDQDVARDTRRNAIFWLGQEAEEAATAGLKEIIASDDDVEVRKQAVFALSQRSNSESIPALISLVRNKNTDPRITKQAIFWLSQKDDPRVLALLEEILMK